MSSKICKECGHSCHCRDVCNTWMTKENETRCDCNDCRCEETNNEIPYISGLIVIKEGIKQDE